MSNEPNITILGKIHRNELQITNRHKPVLDKLKAMGYITSTNGSFILTPEGINCLKEFETE